jgi:hypothetical protein
MGGVVDVGVMCWESRGRLRFREGGEGLVITLVSSSVGSHSKTEYWDRSMELGVGSSRGTSLYTGGGRECRE